MAATFNLSMIMTSDFYQDNYSDDMDPSSNDIERVLGIKLDPDLVNFVDSITPKQAHEYLCRILNVDEEK